jgi:putative IMPACT (imprinted ancient) family translation regulator
MVERSSGIPGLIAAYKAASQLALDKAEKVLKKNAISTLH